MMLGSHLSIAGGMVNALIEAESLGLDTVQVFTKNQRQWKTKPLDPDARDAWLEKLTALGWQSRTVAHDSYLINLATPKDDLYEKSVALMREELDRADALSIRYLVSHPGAHTGSGVEAGIARIAAAHKALLADTAGSDVVLCLENTAGGGSTIGRTFEELATLRELITSGPGAAPPERVGFCIDTCHALAAGYDLHSHPGGVLDELDRVCGIEHVRVLHLNDSKGALGSHVDRHEHIGAGAVGLRGFEAVVNHPGLAGVPMIMETPKGAGEDGRPYDLINAEALRGLAGAKSR